MQFPTLPAHYKWGKGSTLAAQGMLGGTDTMVCRVDFFCENGAETQKSASKISFLGHRWDGLCNKITATWLDPPSKPSIPPALGFGWVTGCWWKFVRWSGR